MSVCSVGYNQKTMHNRYIESEFNFLQQKFETNVDALDKLLGSYNKELTNLTEFIRRDVVVRNNHCLTSTPEKNTTVPQNINTKTTSNKVPPKPLPKPPNLIYKTKSTKDSNLDSLEINLRSAAVLRSNRTSSSTSRTSRSLANITNRSSESSASDYKRLLQRSYSQLVNYISCTQDIAARLYQNEMLTLLELDSIQKTRTMGRANENLLNILLRKPIEVVHALLAELQRTHQSHVLSMLTNADNDCFGCEASDILHHSKLIRQNYVDLTESLEVEGLLNHLLAGGVITERENEDIAAEWNKHRQTESLLTIIARKSSEDYTIFLQALVKTNQKHIYDILQGIPGGDSSARPKTVKICTTPQSRKGTNEKTTTSVKPKQRLRGSWVNGPRLPFSIRVDISTKILALQRTKSTNIDSVHVDNLLKGFVSLRKTVFSMETERSNKEAETEQALTMNSALTAQNDQLEYELRKVRRYSEGLHAELNSRSLEVQKSKLQQNDATIEKDRMHSQLREAELANGRLKGKLLEAAKEIKRIRDSVLESDEFKQLKQDRDRLEQRLKDTETELENQKRLILREKESHANERERLQRVQRELELQAKHVNCESDSRFAELTRQADKNNISMEQFINEIKQLKIRIVELENEKHELLDELNIEREKNSQNEHIRNIPNATDVTGYQVNHVGRLEIGGSWVEGAAVLDSKLYVACRGSATLIVHSTQAPHSRQYLIQIPGMTGPIDIVACSTHHCLYVTDLGSTCVWQVRADHKSCKWLSNATWPYTLSVTRSGFVLMARRPSNLDIYGPCANLIHSIRLPDVVLDPCHAVETSDGTYLVSHGEKLSHRHSVTELTREGRILRSYGGPLGQNPRELDRPRYLAVDGYGNVLIADYGNNRIVMLDSGLKFADILLKKDDDGIKNPHRVSFHDNGIVSVVSGGIVDLYGLTNAPNAVDSSYL